MKHQIMRTQANKSQENKNQSIKNAQSQIKSDTESAFQFIDNRHQAVNQGQLQETAKNIPQGNVYKAEKIGD